MNQFIEIDQAPCSETLRYFICTIDPTEFSNCCSTFSQHHNVQVQWEHLAIDGKTMRGAKNKTTDAIHLFSVWSKTQGITLAMMESEGRKNEIKTLAKFIDIL